MTVQLSRNATKNVNCWGADQERAAINAFVMEISATTYTALTTSVIIIDIRYLSCMQIFQEIIQGVLNGLIDP